MILSVACVGAGYFSQFHYGSWARLAQVRLVGACDSNVTRAEATGYPSFSDLAEMLDRTQPDVLDIILPPSAHANAISLALAHGVKTIICQKPFCQTLDEAQAVVEAAGAAGARLIVHENFRFMPWYRTVHAALKAGMIGAVQQVTFRLRPGDGQGPDAYMDRQPYFQKMPRLLVHETGVHWVDTFRFLLGEATAVYADLRQVNPVLAGEDAGYVLFDYPSGARALLDGNRALDHKADNLRHTMGEGLLEGPQGSITLTGDGAVVFRRFGGTNTKVLRTPDVSDGFGGDCVHHLQSHVVSALLHGTPLENEARDYLKVLEIEQSIYRSAETGSKQWLKES